MQWFTGLHGLLRQVMGSYAAANGCVHVSDTLLRLCCPIQVCITLLAMALLHLRSVLLPTP